MGAAANCFGLSCDFNGSVVGNFAMSRESLSNHDIKSSSAVISAIFDGCGRSLLSSSHCKRSGSSISTSLLFSFSFTVSSILASDNASKTPSESSIFKLSLFSRLGKSKFSKIWVAASTSKSGSNLLDSNSSLSSKMDSSWLLSIDSSDSTSSK